jgi:hypothetical protein
MGSGRLDARCYKSFYVYGYAYRYIFSLYTFEHYKSHKVRLVFKGNVTDKSINTHAHEVCEVKCSSVYIDFVGLLVYVFH